MPHPPRVHIGTEHTSNDVAEVGHVVHVRQCTGDEDVPLSSLRETKGEKREEGRKGRSEGRREGGREGRSEEGREEGGREGGRKGGREGAREGGREGGKERGREGGREGGGLYNCGGYMTRSDSKQAEKGRVMRKMAELLNVRMRHIWALYVLCN